MRSGEDRVMEWEENRREKEMGVGGGGQEGRRESGQAEY